MDPFDEMKKTQSENTSWVEQAERTRIDHAVVLDEGEKTRPIVVFQVGKITYGVEIGDIREVVKTPRIAPIPQTPDYVIGAGNVRGNVLAMIDVEHRIEGSSGQPKEYVMVLNSTTTLIGLLVQKVPDTIMVKNKQISRSASVIQNLGREDKYITGLVKLDDKMIFLIDIKELI